jgi:hypothetical protein
MCNIPPNTQPRRSHKNPQRQIKHIRHHVIETQHHERERRPPDSDDFAEELAAHERQVSREADEPVGTYAAQEDLVPSRREGFGCCEGYYAGVEQGLAEGPAVAGDEGHDEERAGKVTEEGYGPVEEHFPGRDAAVEAGDCC